MASMFGSDQDIVTLDCFGAGRMVRHISDPSPPGFPLLAVSSEPGIACCAEALRKIIADQLQTTLSFALPAGAHPGTAAQTDCL